MNKQQIDLVLKLWINNLGHLQEAPATAAGCCYDAVLGMLSSEPVLLATDPNWQTILSWRSNSGTPDTAAEAPHTTRILFSILPARKCRPAPAKAKPCSA